MIGLRRLESLQAYVLDVLHRGIPGDLIETGVWRGGAAIFMRAILKAYGDAHRILWVADSFEGFPEPDLQRYPLDKGYGQGGTHKAITVSLEQVKRNFAHYGLLEDQVHFLPGWFRDTLPSAPIERLALLRLDGDIYESTMVALGSLYSKPSVGGYVIVDDYKLARRRTAVDDFRSEHLVTEELQQIDWTGVCWQRQRQALDRTDHTRQAEPRRASTIWKKSSKGSKGTPRSPRYAASRRRAKTRSAASAAQPSE